MSINDWPKPGKPSPRLFAKNALALRGLLDLRKHREAMFHELTDRGDFPTLRRKKILLPRRIHGCACARKKLAPRVAHIPTLHSRRFAGAPLV